MHKTRRPLAKTCQTTASTTRPKRRLHRIASIVFALAVWQMAAMLVGQDLLLPSPLTVLLRLMTIWQLPGFFSAICFTFERIVCGFLLALFLGTLLGALAGRFSLFQILFSPFAVTIKSVPVASFIVIFLIWLPVRQLSFLISFLMVLPVIYTNVLTGMQSTAPTALEVCQVFSLPWWRRLVYLWLPQLRPFLLSACGVGLGLAWKAGIAAEIIGIPSGSIGRMFYEAKLYLNTTDLFAWTVIVVCISVLFEQFFLRLLRVLFRRLEKL